jgi:hypothetical protein
MDKNKETTEDSKRTEHLNKLLLFAPPTELRRSIQKTLFSYLSEFGTEPVPVDYLQVVENHFFLIGLATKKWTLG